MNQKSKMERMEDVVIIATGCARRVATNIVSKILEIKETPSQSEEAVANYLLTHDVTSA
jgi:hypothetical protein